MINGASKTTHPVSSGPVVTQSAIMATATCNIAPDLPSCVLVAPQQPNDMAPPAKRKKIFEVETVTEVDSPSPDTSEMSAHSSIENLAFDTESVAPCQVQPVKESARVGSLESRSDSYISIHQARSSNTVVRLNGGPVDFGIGGSSSNTPEPSLPLTSYHEQTSNASSMPPLPQQQVGSTAYDLSSEAALKNRSISVGNVPPDMESAGYCHYNTAPQWHGVSIRQPIASDTFSPPVTVTHTYHGHHVAPRARLYPVEPPHVSQVVAQASQPVMQESDRNQGISVSNVPVYHQLEEHASRPRQTGSSAEKQRRSSPARALTIDDFPQAALLSQAFMQFMYSMSTVFRDPTYQPLIDSLDERFGGHHTEKPSSAPPNVVSKQVELVQQEGEEEAGTVVRSSTQPSLTKYKERDSNLDSIVMK